MKEEENCSLNQLAVKQGFSTKGTINDESYGLLAGVFDTLVVQHHGCFASSKDTTQEEDWRASGE